MILDILCLEYVFGHFGGSFYVFFCYCFCILYSRVDELRTCVERPGLTIFFLFVVVIVVQMRMSKSYKKCQKKEKENKNMVSWLGFHFSINKLDVALSFEVYYFPLLCLLMPVNFVD